jgi:hypothetical protein
LPYTTVLLGPASALQAPDLVGLLPPAPALRLSVAEVRWLLRALLPLPCLDLRAVLALLRYQRRHKLAAYWSHRQQRLQRLEALYPP